MSVEGFEIFKDIEAGHSVVVSIGIGKQQVYTADAPPDFHIHRIKFIDITFNQGYFCSRLHHYDTKCIDDRGL
jgi:hypothetical protein